MQQAQERIKNVELQLEENNDIKLHCEDGVSINNQLLLDSKKMMGESERRLNQIILGLKMPEERTH
jgi:hypothetical protein